ncbi:tetratricopeptide repeat protein [Moritella viscosa]|uniref:tetratricopeptide repeat protein n=1 Tax=Moritella viscosa TaxID=80854 RepID=UPI00091DDF7F|nr:tetratricopeptide repeat protein [Moritella viscosa]SGZ08380.1 TPR repeat-containing protein [Moritella viscosa]
MSVINRLMFSIFSMPLTVFMSVIIVSLTGCVSSTTLVEPNDHQLAEIAMTGGRPDSAVEIYRRLIEASPNDIQLLYLLGRAYNQVGEHDLALHYLAKASSENRLAGHAERGDILRETGRVQLAQGQTDQAVIMLQQARELLPEDAIIQNSLGICYSLYKKYDLARSAFTAALAIEPGSLEYRNNLALGWILDDKPQKGIDVLYPTYLRGKSTAKIRQNLALAFAMKGDIEAAKEIAKDDLTKAELANNVAYYTEWKASQ